MGMTLDDVLVLAGDLDDVPGFDTPRERFRRFLIGQDTDAHAARRFVEQCPHLVDEQHHRALQDLVVLLGRSLGFETTFGTYAPAGGGLKLDGHWRSRARLEVVLELRTNLTPSTDSEELARSIAVHAGTVRRGSQKRVIGLAVLAPGYAGRNRFEQALATSVPDVPIRFVSLRSLLFLVDMLSAGRVTHDDVVRLLDTVAAPEFVVGLLERASHLGAPDLADSRIPPHELETGPAFWLATVDGDSAITPERFLEVVIGKRRIFGVREAGHPGGSVRPGDRICFYVSGRGAVGRADVASIEPKGTGLRDVHQYSQLLRLDNVDLYPDAPIVLDSETTLRLRAAQGDSNATWHPFMQIPERAFHSLTQRERPVALKGQVEAPDRLDA
jgi:hypothetical protein